MFIISNFYKDQGNWGQNQIMEFVPDQGGTGNFWVISQNQTFLK